MAQTKREKELMAKYKAIAQGSPIKVTGYAKNNSNVRFRGNGHNVVRQIGSNTASVSPELQLRAMIKLAKLKKKLRGRK